MARLLKQATRVFALFMMVGTALQASFAQDARSKDRTVASCTSLEKIFPLTLKEVGSPKKGYYKFPVRRFGAPIPAQVLADCGNAAFTAVFEFKTETRRPSSTFVVQPRTLLTEPPLWYTVRKTTQVYVSIQLPEAPGDNAQSPNLLIDVMCDVCSTDGAEVRYQPAVPAESMERASLYYSLSEEDLFEPSEERKFSISLLPPGTQTSRGETTHTITFKKEALCSNVYGAVVGVTFTSTPQKEAFHWISESSRSPKPYEAQVGAEPSQGSRIIHFRVEKEGAAFCKTDSNDKIVLQIRCQNECSFTEDVAVMRLFASVFHQNSQTIVDSLYGYWDNNLRICYVTYRVNDIPRSVLREVRDDDSLSLSYLPAMACDGDDKGEALPSSFWQRQALAQTLKNHLSQRLESLPNAFSIEQCLCRGLEGHLYLRVNWGPIEESKKKKGDTGGLKRDKELMDYSSFSQSIECSPSRGTSECTLVADISAPEIRCARSSVTAVFRMSASSSTDIASINAYYDERRSIARPSLATNVLEVGLTSGTTASSIKTCKALEIAEVLPIEVYCEYCTKVIADVQFISNPSLEIIQADRPKLKPFKNATTDRLRAYRVSAVVHDDVLSRGPGAKFTAILQVNGPMNPGEPRYFAARPRTLLAHKDAWYVKAGFEGPFQLYMSLQLPGKPGDKSQPSTIVVDIECNSCDPNDVKLLYSVERPEMSFREARYYSDAEYYLGEEECDHTALSGSLDRHEPIFTVVLDKTDLCVNPFGAVVVVFGRFSNAKFYWALHSLFSSSDTRTPPKSYPAVVGRVYNSDHYYVVFRTHEEEMDFCGQTANTKLTLKIDCVKDCANSARSGFLCLPKSPQVLQQGVSLEPIANLAATFRKQGASPVCNLIVLDNKRSEVLQLVRRRSAFFRLWHTAPMSCKEPVDTALRALEAQLALGTATVEQPIITTQCICEGLQGGVYRLLDWGPVEEEKDRSGMEDKGGQDKRGTVSEKNGKPKTPTDMRNTKGATTKDISSGSMTMGSNKAGRTREEVSPEFKLLPNTASSGKTQKGRVVFENWISAERLHSMVPFVTMFCFKSSPGSIESVSLAETVPLQSFKSPGKNLQCYAFNSCDAWRAAPASPPQIVVVGKSVPKSVHWRLDEATPFASLSPEGSHASRGGWYGTAEQRKRFNAVKGVVEAKVIKTASSFECIFSDLSNKEGSQGAGDATEAAPSSTAETFVFLVPSYQLTPTEGLLLSSSGDMCSFGISVFVGVFVILALYEEGTLTIE